ncbi:GCG_CRPN prefix-to-repeats domain-containing protein [Labrys neptuniae]
MFAKIALAAMGGSFLALTSFGVQAMPTSYALSQTTAYNVTKIAGGCGVGFYRGRLGGCIRAGRGVVIAPRPVVVVPRPVVRPRPVVIDRRPIVIR